MGLEALYFVGALILLAGLIYAPLSWHYRNRAADRVGEDIVRARYKRNET